MQTSTPTQGAGNQKNLIPREGTVGTYKDLTKAGRKRDNLTPHHMPSDQKMMQAGVKRNDGVSINMEQPSPRIGGRHRETFTYGKSGSQVDDYLNLSYRDALAKDIMDVRRIYMKDGLYTSKIRKGLLNVIKQNKMRYPSLFNK